MGKTLSKLFIGKVGGSVVIRVLLLFYLFTAMAQSQETETTNFNNIKDLILKDELEGRAQKLQNQSQKEKEARLKRVKGAIQCSRRS